MFSFLNKKKLKKYKNYFLKDNLNKEIKNGLAEIGDWTYGNPKIMRWDTTDKLKVGKFSSIGPGVTIIFGGNHRHDWITTSPLPADTFQAYEKFTNVKNVNDFIYSKGDVIIGNDVWIGANTLILSGSYISDGSVVAAGSVVSGKIEPYTIVGGNPVREIKKRFDDLTIDKLLKIKWWELSDDEVNKYSKLLCSDEIQKFLDKFE